MNLRYFPHDPIRSIRRVSVLQIEVYRGDGTEDDPGRLVTQWWSTDDDDEATLLAERDSCPTKSKSEREDKPGRVRTAGE